MANLMITNFKVNGKDYIEFLNSTIYENKYDFKESLTEFLDKFFKGTSVLDVDFANEFGEDSNEIYIETNPKLNIECFGYYDDDISDEGIILA